MAHGCTLRRWNRYLTWGLAHITLDSNRPCFESRTALLFESAAVLIEVVIIYGTIVEIDILSFHLSFIISMMFDSEVRINSKSVNVIGSAFVIFVSSSLESVCDTDMLWTSQLT